MHTDYTRMSRRAFFGQAGAGALALAALLDRDCAAATASHADLPHFAPKARRVIYLFQSGGPSQMDLFDYKPGLRDRRGEDVPASVSRQRKMTMSRPDELPVAHYLQSSGMGRASDEQLPRAANRTRCT